MDEAGEWSPREDFNLHYRVRSPGVCALAYEGNESEPPGRVELPLAAYKAATLRSVGGVVTSRGIEPRSLGLQPSAMTTLARWSEWSRCRESNPDLLLTGQACGQQHFIDVVVQARGLEPRSFGTSEVNSAVPVLCDRSAIAQGGNRPDVLPLDEAWMWSRRLGSNQHGSA
jgi:hypothetical protein